MAYTNTNFSDNNMIVNNKHRGFVVEPRFMYSSIDASYYERWDATYGDLEMMWFVNEPFIHEVGRVIKWERDGIVVGQGIVHSWSHDFNVILHSITGEFAESGDKLINYELDSFLYISDYVTWKELEPTKGNYDWATVDAKLMRDFCIANGKKLVMGLALDYPSTVEHRDIPDWLYDEIDGEGVNYSYTHNVNPEKGFSPNYSHPALIANHANVISAIKNHYGDLIYSMEMGSIGHWGEMHTYGTFSGVGSMPPNNIVAQYIGHYLANFDNTQLRIRRPIDPATVAEIGLYFQMLGGPDHLYESWGLLNIATNGYVDEYGFTQIAYPNFREKSPISGEHDPWVDDDSWEADFSNNATGRNYTRTLQMARDLEMSLVRSFPQVHLYRTDGIAVKANVEDFRRKIGYRFIIKTFSRELVGTTLNIGLIMENKGIARCYTDYPVNLIFMDDSYNILGSTPLPTVKLTEVLRGTQKTFMIPNVPYVSCTKLGIQIVDIQIPINTYKPSYDIYHTANVVLTSPTTAKQGYSEIDLDISGQVLYSGLKNGLSQSNVLISNEGLYKKIMGGFAQIGVNISTETVLYLIRSGGANSDIDIDSQGGYVVIRRDGSQVVINSVASGIGDTIKIGLSDSRIKFIPFASPYGYKSGLGEVGISVDVESAIKKIALGLGNASVEIFSDGNGVVLKSGGRETGIEVYFGGEGIRRIFNDSFVNLAVSAIGQGKKTGAGSGISNIDINAVYDSLKIAYNSAYAEVVNVAESMGMKIIKNGSDVSVVVDSSGNGFKIGLGLSDVDIAIALTGLGIKLGLGKSDIELFINSVGDGNKSGKGASNSGIGVYSVLEYEPLKNGGVEIIVAVNADGLSQKLMSGENYSSIKYKSDGVGKKTGLGGDYSVIRIITNSEGEILFKSILQVDLFENERMVNMGVDSLATTGNTVRLWGEFKDYNNQPVEVEDVIITIYDSRKVELLSVSPEYDSRGRFFYDYVVPDTRGKFYYEFSGIVNNTINVGRRAVDKTWISDWGDDYDE